VGGKPSQADGTAGRRGQRPHPRRRRRDEAARRFAGSRELRGRGAPRAASWTRWTRRSHERRAEGPRVLMLLGNGFAPDPRVEAEALALVRAGADVTVLCWDRDGDLAPSEERGGITCAASVSRRPTARERRRR